MLDLVLPKEEDNLNFPKFSQNLRDKNIKVGINPLAQNKIKLCFDGCRFIYNYCVECFKNQKSISENSLWDYLSQKEFLSDIPKDILQIPMKEFFKMYEKGMRKISQKKITSFDIDYRTKKDTKIEFLNLSKDFYKNNSIFPEYFGENLFIKCSEDIPEYYSNDFQIIRIEKK